MLSFFVCFQNLNLKYDVVFVQFFRTFESTKNAIISGEFSRSSSSFRMLFDNFDAPPLIIIISLSEFFNHDSGTFLLPRVNVVVIYGLYIYYIQYIVSVLLASNIGTCNNDFLGHYYYYIFFKYRIRLLLWTLSAAANLLCRKSHKITSFCVTTI